ncbi:molecular chaperone DnaJ [Pseudoroseomonas wenyumeiae]|uniref:Molecular chaperone DnaJ n=1 Tax=Teichococcus wenyumeiae TaxID=2478470 RepID=A0A3A9JCK3_9PROT|nr:molecular chaperone DnaJ [Pseudoroseomonas wenyumeiae]RKK02305.1 molecular chaperone DnaJ [Pseudoroseomonas wenyumeiae]RMI26540.1 molecular chaperone DnaJ [Pseudoroseomonas wenyumeiae]
MIWLAGAIGVLLLGWVLLRALATASVAQVKRGALWFLIGMLLAGVALLLLTRRLPQALGLMLPLMPLLLPAVRRWLGRRRFGAAPPDQGVSTLETPTLAMRLDQASGTLSGRVRTGPFAGRELGEMPLEDCLALLAQCHVEDPESVPLLEAWLDRAAPGWRQASPGAGMDRAEALAVLELPEGATPAQIRAAHRRLMRQAHPDHGGDAWRAARLNQARDLLLKPRP